MNRIEKKERERDRERERQRERETERERQRERERWIDNHMNTKPVTGRQNCDLYILIVDLMTRFSQITDYLQNSASDTFCHWLRR